jgi:putative sterol carrier protein
MTWHDDVVAVLEQYAADQIPPREQVKAAVKGSLARLVELVPGRAVEVRVPPYGAVQVIGGTSHRRGTPPAVVECDSLTWLKLAIGEFDWQQALMSGRLHASGARSDLSELLPLPQS